jgi:uncharacterized membrane protein YeaQ/YmgE (transglycosylase-associated protein family)
METIGAVIVWIVFGLFIGLIGRLLVPGRQPMGFLATIVLGIAGSFAGGFLTYLFRGGEPLQPTGILMSIIGAIIVLVLGTSLTAKRV